MKSLNIHFTNPCFRYAFLNSIALFFWVQSGFSQNSKPWVLPRHQLQIQLGTGAIAGIHPANYPNSSGIYGIAYNLNVTRHLFASFDYQVMSNGFDLFKNNIPTTEKARKVQVFNYKDLGESYSLEQNANNTLFELTSNEGFIRRQNYNFSAGYMTVTTRNILRFGLGGSYSAYQARRVESKVTRFGNADYLYIYDDAKWYLNFTFSYDFFIKQNWTIGLRSNFIFQETFMPFGACLTFGYAPIFNNNKKNSKVPRV